MANLTIPGVNFAITQFGNLLVEDKIFDADGKNDADNGEAVIQGNNAIQGSNDDEDAAW